ncbi:MAG: hypothetical protein AAGG02_09550 [Cyanobacteria bacterium P01_H01_bin.15]
MSGLSLHALKIMAKAKTPKRSRTSRTSVPADLMNRLKAIASIKFELEQKPTNADVMEATVSFLEKDNAPKVAESINSLGATMQWLTSQIDTVRSQIICRSSHIDVSFAIFLGSSVQFAD